MLAKSQTRTCTSASPSLILDCLQALIPYNLQDNQTQRAQPHQHSNSSARSFPRCSAQLSTHRLASAIEHGAQILTIPRSPPLTQQQVLQGKPAAVGQGHWDPHKAPHCTPKLAPGAATSHSWALLEPCRGSGRRLQLVNNPVLISALR